MLSISGQEVAKQILSGFREIALYEGAGSRIRTDDLLITNQLLYQLSYAGKKRGRTVAQTDATHNRVTIVSAK